MHESIIPAVERVCREDGVSVADQYEVTITHLGYQGDLSRKHQRNLPLLRQAVLEDPGRVYLYLDLGSTLEGLGLYKDAEEALRAGLCLAAGSSTSMQSKVEGSLCANLLSNILLRRGEAKQALDISLSGLELYADNLALQRARANALLALDRCRDAIAAIEPVTVNNTEQFFDPRLAYPKSMFEVDFPVILATAYFQLGAYARAADYFDQAALGAPGSIHEPTARPLAATTL